jgi:hypothetical protein
MDAPHRQEASAENLAAPVSPDPLSVSLGCEVQAVCGVVAEEARPSLIARLSRSEVVAASGIAWGVLAVVISLLVVVSEEHTVTAPYRHASTNWFAGRAIYTAKGDSGFLYFPSAAILFAPFVALPYQLGEIAWRLLGIGLFAVGVWRLGALVRPRGRGALFCVMTLASIPVAASCARNGQSTLAMTAMMMLGVVDLDEEHRWRAAMWLSLGLALKPLVLPLILTLAILDRRLAPRLVLAVAVVLLFPFLTQSSGYVAGQYSRCLAMLQTAASVGATGLWAQPFSVFGELGLVIPERVQTIVRVLAAAGTLCACLAARRRNGSGRAAAEVFSLCVLYILLFNPRTENNTYAMIGPVLGLFAGEAILLQGIGLRAVFLSVLVLVLVLFDELFRCAGYQGEQVICRPAVGGIVLIDLLWHVFAKRPASSAIARYAQIP